MAYSVGDVVYRLQGSSRKGDGILSHFEQCRDDLGNLFVESAEELSQASNIPIDQVALALRHLQDRTFTVINTLNLQTEEELELARGSRTGHHILNKERLLRSQVRTYVDDVQVQSLRKEITNQKLQNERIRKVSMAQLCRRLLLESHRCKEIFFNAWVGVLKDQRKENAEARHVARMEKGYKSQVEEVEKRLEEEEETRRKLQKDLKKLENIHEQLERIQLVRVNSMFRAFWWKVIGEMFEKWRADTKFAKRATRILRGVLVQELRAAWRQWCDHMSERLALKRRAGKVVMRLANACLSRAFTHWAQEAVGANTRERKLQKALARLASGTTASAFSRWRAFVAEKWDREALAKKCLGSILNSLLARCFHTWREEVYYELHMSEKAEAHRVRIMKYNLWKAFAAWRAAFRRKKSNRDKAARNLARLRRGLLQKRLHTWWERVARHKRKLKDLAAFEKRRRKNMLGRLLRGWSEHLRWLATSSNRARIVVLCMAKNTMLRAYMKWLDFIRQKEYLNDEADEFDIQRCRRIGVAMLTHWRARTRDNLGLAWVYRAIQSKYFRRLQLSAFNSLSAKATRRRLKKRALTRARDRLAQVRKAQTLAQWRVWHAEAEEERLALELQQDESNVAKARKFMIRVMHHSAITCLQVWRDRTKERQLNRRKFRKFVVRMHRQAEVKCFNVWRMVAEKKGATKQRVLVISRRRRWNAQLRTFSTWHLSTLNALMDHWSERAREAESLVLLSQRYVTTSMVPLLKQSIKGIDPHQVEPEVKDARQEMLAMCDKLVARPVNPNSFEKDKMPTEAHLMMERRVVHLIHAEMTRLQDEVVFMRQSFAEVERQRDLKLADMQRKFNSLRRADNNAQRQAHAQEVRDAEDQRRRLLQTGAVARPSSLSPPHVSHSRRQSSNHSTNTPHHQHHHHHHHHHNSQLNSRQNSQHSTTAQQAHVMAADLAYAASQSSSDTVDLPVISHQPVPAYVKLDARGSGAQQQQQQQQHPHQQHVVASSQKLQHHGSSRHQDQIWASSSQDFLRKQRLNPRPLPKRPQSAMPHRRKPSQQSVVQEYVFPIESLTQR